MSQINSMLSIAQNEIGYLEKKSNSNLDDKTANAGSKNYTKYWRDLKPSWQGSYWCQAFVNWVFVKAFGETKAKEMLYATNGLSYYTPDASNFFKNNKAWYTSPKVGDIIYFKNSIRIHHVGIVIEVSNGRVFTIEGNTSSGKEVIANGGAVCAKDYSLSDSRIAGYGRPKYAESEITYTTYNITTGRAGLVVISSSALNIRKEPSTSSDVVGTLAKGTAIYPETQTSLNGTYWFKIDKGWVSGKYLTGWIKQLERWWYLDSGKVVFNCTKAIDGKTYVFDQDGWMITADRINSNGELI